MDIKKFFAAVPRHARASDTPARENSEEAINERDVEGGAQDGDNMDGEDAIVADADGAAAKPRTSLPTLPSAPYQPVNVSCIPQQRLAKRTLSFQKSWFQKFPWLHFDSDIGGVICFTCAKAARANLADMARCADDAFTVKGFSNWKKAIEKFTAHQKTSTHAISHSNLNSLATRDDVDAQLSTHHRSEQRNARNALLKIITSLQFLAQQGLVIRGKDVHDGNFAKLLELRGDDDDVLKRWLARKTSYTSAISQNELLKIMAHMVLRGICSDIGQFAVIVDGTQDVQGLEQESICVRYVDANYGVHEDFVGLYNIAETTGASLSNMIQDALLRLNLPITDLRAQTYDGASNMSGKYTGCQARIKEVQPLAHYTHCGAHITHLVCSKVRVV